MRSRVDDPGSPHTRLSHYGLHEMNTVVRHEVVRLPIRIRVITLPAPACRSRLALGSPGSGLRCNGIPSCRTYSGSGYEEILLLTAAIWEFTLAPHPAAVLVLPQWRSDDTKIHPLTKGEHAVYDRIEGGSTADREDRRY